MAFDGLFLHHLIDELKINIINKRINKVITINDNDFAFILNGQLTLFITINPLTPHIRLSNEKFLTSQTTLSNFLKKHIDGGIITNIGQYNNDRIIIIDLNSSDDLGYLQRLQIIIELTGKSANLIIVNDDQYILEAAKKNSLMDDRLILVKAKYIFPTSNKDDPYTTSQLLDEYEGMCKQTMQEVSLCGLSDVLLRATSPTLFDDEKKSFYCFDYVHIKSNKISFDTLSELLEHYYNKVIVSQTQSNDQKMAFNAINKDISRLNNKLKKQQNEMLTAQNNQNLEQLANLLAANIHLVKPYQESIIVKDFYNNNEDVIIPLNINIPINKNVDYYFNKVKKNKRTLVLLKETIEQTQNDIIYYDNLLAQLDFVSSSDLKEILIEIGIKKASKLKQKPHITKYITSDNSIVMVGKNNLQNNYLTHTIATKDDYFFHVKNVPGSHVILRGKLSDENIQIAGAIAAHYSKLKNGTNVCVDYTSVKWVKKAKGQKGSFVTYTNEKNVYSNPSLEYILKNAILDR